MATIHALISYCESQLPNAKVLMASWMQLKVYHSQNVIVLEGEEEIVSLAIHELRNHAQRHGETFETFQLNLIDRFTLKNMVAERTDASGRYHDEPALLVPKVSSEVEKK